MYKEECGTTLEECGTADTPPVSCNCLLLELSIALCVGGWVLLGAFVLLRTANKPSRAFNSAGHAFSSHLIWPALRR